MGDALGEMGRYCLALGKKNLQDLPKKCNLDVGLGPTNKEQKDGFCKVQKFMMLED